MLKTGALTAGNDAGNKDSEAWLPQCTNKYKLLSMEFSKMLLRALCPSRDMDLQKLTGRDINLLLCFSLNTSPSSALYCKHKQQLQQDSARQHYAFGEQLKTATLVEGAKGGLVVDWQQTGYFKMVEDDAGTHLFHASGLSVTVPQNMLAASSNWHIESN